MATGRKRSPEEVRLHIEAERDRLAASVDNLRDDVGRMASLKGKLPAATAAAFGVGFVAAGGIGAIMRLVMRRGREGKTKAKFGPFSLVDRD